MLVHRSQPSLVTPASGTPVSQPPLPLSPIDQSMMHSRLDFLYMYDAHTASLTHMFALATAATAHTMLDSPVFMDEGRLQHSLSVALNDYRVLAGRLSLNHHGKHCIKLSDEGVSWISATAAVTLNDIRATGAGGGYDHSRMPHTLLTSLPLSATSSTPLLQIQFTRLSCGGVTLGLSVYNFCLDGDAFFMFIRCWSLTSRGLKVGAIIHDRGVINELRASPNTNYVHDEFLIVEKPSLSSPRHGHSIIGNGANGSSRPGSPLVVPSLRVVTFRFTADEIDRMKSLCLGQSSPALTGINSPTVTSTSMFQLGQSALQSQSQSHTGSLSLVTPLRRSSSSTPSSPRSNTVLPYHSHYVSTFDVLAAHVWQLAMRARYPALVAALPQPINVLESNSANNSNATSPIPSPVVSPSHAHSMSQSQFQTFFTPPSVHRSPLNMSVPRRQSSFNVSPLPTPSIAHLSSSTSSLQPADSELLTDRVRDRGGCQLTHCSIAFNGRNRFEPPLPDTLCANLTFFALVPATLARVLTSDLRSLCRMIRDKMNRMVDEYLRSALTVLAAPLAPNAKLVPTFAGCLGTTDLLLTSFLKSPVYSGADFGHGQPAYVGLCHSLESKRWEGMVAFLPSPAHDGSVDVTLCLRDDEMRRLESDVRLHFFRDAVVDSLLDGIEGIKLQEHQLHRARSQGEQHHRYHH